MYKFFLSPAMWSVCMKRHKEHSERAKEWEEYRERASKRTIRTKVKINCAHVTMKMTTCSVKFYHIQQYVVAFQEIEEMQIKLAAAIVHTHTVYSNDVEQFATKIGV